VPLLCLTLFWERWKHQPAPELLKASTGPLILFSMLALTLLPSCLLLESEYGTISGRALLSLFTRAQDLLHDDFNFSVGC
jgi:hypothetical protein